MTFDGQYLTYQEYLDLGGSQIEELPFNLLEFEARRRIDIKTFNRLKECDEIPQEVKLCVYEMINRMSTYDETLNEVASKGNVASENTDGYSVSYVNSTQAVDIIRSKSTELDDIIKTYLLGVVVNGEHLMYCGVR